MHVLFVGGLLHGTSNHIADNLKWVEVDNPRLKAGRQIYEVHRWDSADAARGYDGLCVNRLVSASEREERIRDALDTAAKTI